MLNVETAAAVANECRGDAFFLPGISQNFWKKFLGGNRFASGWEHPNRIGVFSKEWGN